MLHSSAKHVNQTTDSQHEPWNAGRIVGAKPPLKPKHVWALCTRLQIANRVRDLAMFNLAIDSKLRGCDLVTLSGRTLGVLRSSNSEVVMNELFGRDIRSALAVPPIESTAAAIGVSPAGGEHARQRAESQVERKVPPAFNGGPTRSGSQLAVRRMPV